MVLAGPGTSWTLTAVPSADGFPDGYPPGDGLPGDAAGRARLTAALRAGIPATVPGVVHTDLMAAGLLADPHLGLNEAAARWAGLTDWRYTARFSTRAPAPGERARLVFEGLDTIAEIRLNGQDAGSARTMHRMHRFEVTGLLVEGGNVLEVTFRSAVRAAQEAERAYGTLPQDYEYPYQFIRKTAAHFGWDWGPTLVTAGIWRPVRLERTRGAWTGPVTLQARVSTPEAGPGHLAVRIPVDAAGPARAAVRVTVPEAGVDCTAEMPVTGGAVSLALDVPSPDRWWPAGYGPQRLYGVAVEADVTGPDGVRTRWRSRHRAGFRHVRLATEPDATGREFVIEVNGQPVFVKGANWVPADTFLPRLGPERYRALLDAAAGANLNLLRVWGGGCYEDEAFYTGCDERGLLVWQDFLFACAAYPQDAAFLTEVAAEAREAAARLAAHPSVVLLCGSNENDLGAADWGWAERAPGLPWGEVIGTQVLRDAAADAAPGLPYIPSSPTSLDPAVHPNDPDHGCTHLWDPWNRLDHAHYRDTVPRFAAEYGWQAPPSRSLLRATLGADPEHPHTPGMLAHSKQAGGPGRLDRNLREHFAPPRTFADWHLATSLNQAWALRTAIGHLRSWWPRCSGSVIWQLNDCWPVTSWSLIDSAGVPKPAWYAVRDACAPRLVTLQPREGIVTAFLVNDTASPWTAPLSLRRHDLAGAVLAEHQQQVTVPPRAVACVAVPASLRAARRRRAEVLLAEVPLAGVPLAGELPDGGPPVRRAEHWFVPDDAVLVPPRALRAEVRRLPGGYQVDVEALALQRDVLLLADLAHPQARADDALVTLLPGERHTFRVTCPPLPSPQALAGPHILRCANEVTRDHR